MSVVIGKEHMEMLSHLNTDETAIAECVCASELLWHDIPMLLHGL